MIWCPYLGGILYINGIQSVKSSYNLRGDNQFIFKRDGSMFHIWFSHLLLQGFTITSTHTNIETNCLVESSSLIYNCKWCQNCNMFCLRNNWCKLYFIVVVTWVGIIFVFIFARAIVWAKIPMLKLQWSIACINYFDSD